MLNVTKPLYVDRRQHNKPIAIRERSQRPSKTPQKIIRLSKHSTTLERPLIKNDNSAIQVMKQSLMTLLTECNNNWERWVCKRREIIQSVKEEHRIIMQTMMKKVENMRKKAYFRHRHACKTKLQKGCGHCSHRDENFIQEAHDYLRRSDLDSLLRQDKENSEIREQQPRHNPLFFNSDSFTQPSTFEDVPKRQQEKKKSGFRHTSRLMSRAYYGEEAAVVVIRDGKRQKSRIHRSSETSQKQEEVTSLKLIKKVSVVDIDTSLIESKSEIQEEKGLSQKIYVTKKVIKDKFVNHHNITDSKKQDQLHKSRENANKQVPIEVKATPSSQPKTDSTPYRMNNIGKSPNRNSKVGASGRDNVRRIFERNSRKKATRFGGGSTKNSELGRNRLDQLSRTQLNSSAYNKSSQLRQTEQRTIRPQDQVIFQMNRMSLLKQPKGMAPGYLLKKRTANDSNQADLLELPSDDEKEESLNNDQEIESEESEEEELKDRKPQSMVQKLSRYQRQRVFYELLERQISKVEGIDSLQESISEMSSEDIVTNLIEHTMSRLSRRGSLNKTYNVNEWKEILVNRLNIFDQVHTFDALRNKVQEILDKPDVANQLARNRQIIEKNLSTQIVEKFLSEVLQITDLKRLMKQKFLSEEDWNRKMRELHQFYIYLEYTLFAFRAKLDRLEKEIWKRLASEGQDMQKYLQKLIFQSEQSRWKGIQARGYEQEFELQRQIECSMKYYGIEVQRDSPFYVYKYEQPQLPPPSKSAVEQRSMKEIQEAPQQASRSKASEFPY